MLYLLLMAGTQKAAKFTNHPPLSLLPKHRRTEDLSFRKTNDIIKEENLCAMILGFLYGKASLLSYPRMKSTCQ
jgi:hypothetical protein